MFVLLHEPCILKRTCFYPSEKHLIDNHFWYGLKPSSVTRIDFILKRWGRPLEDFFVSSEFELNIFQHSNIYVFGNVYVP